MFGLRDVAPRPARRSHRRRGPRLRHAHDTGRRRLDAGLGRVRHRLCGLAGLRRARGRAGPGVDRGDVVLVATLAAQVNQQVGGVYWMVGWLFDTLKTVGRYLRLARRRRRGAPSRRRPAGRARPAGGRHPLRRRRVPLPGHRHAGARRRRPAPARGRHGGRRRRQRRGQEHADQAAVPASTSRPTGAVLVDGVDLARMPVRGVARAGVGRVPGLRPARAHRPRDGGRRQPGPDRRCRVRAAARWSGRPRPTSCSPCPTGSTPSWAGVRRRRRAVGRPVAEARPRPGHDARAARCCWCSTSPPRPSTPTPSTRCSSATRARPVLWPGDGRDHGARLAPLLDRAHGRPHRGRRRRRPSSSAAPTTSSCHTQARTPSCTSSKPAPTANPPPTAPPQRISTGTVPVEMQKRGGAGGRGGLRRRWRGSRRRRGRSRRSWRGTSRTAAPRRPGRRARGRATSQPSGARSPHTVFELSRSRGSTWPRSCAADPRRRGCTRTWRGPRSRAR